MTSPLTPHILLVEDNPQDADLLMRALQKGGILNPVQVVEDGAEALEWIFCRGRYAQENPNILPRLIFLDIKLPKVDGFEVLEQIKTSGRTRAIPVVMVTSSREAHDIRRAYALGANSYLVKPVDFEHYFEMVRIAGQYWMSINQPI
jgi:two-component system, response regulator